MEQHIIKLLQEENHSTELQDLLKYWKDLLRMSRMEMKKYFDVWDKNDQVYRGEIAPDESDKKASARGEPTKMVVPLTYQQVQTFTSFMQQVFTQRSYFYELDGVSPEDCSAAKVAAALLEQNLAYNKFKGIVLKEFCDNVAKFGVGILKHSWTHDTVPIIEDVPDPKFVPNPAVMGQQPPTIPQVRDVTKFEGNKIMSILPFRFMPDTRLPLTRMQEGEFVGSYDEYSRTDLQQMEANGDTAGVEHIREIPITHDDTGRRLTFIELGKQSKQTKSHYVMIDEIQVRLNPARTEIAPGVMLDKRIDREIKYLAWIANDNRIVRLEPLAYMHGEFTYDVAQFTSDQMKLINFGLAELLGPLQDTISWLINSRMASVRKVINNFLVVDPDAIEFSDLQSRSPVIRLKRKYAGTGIDSVIKQLNIQDVTTNHLNDVNVLADWARDTSGITENLMGSFASGRRSAQEARNVANNSSARLLLIAHALWESALLPLGRKMISNLRQGLSEPTLIQMYGVANSQLNQQGVMAFKRVTKEQIAGDYDFLVFDGTQPGARAFTAQVLTQLLEGMAKDPRLVMVFGYDPKLLIQEILELHDVRNASRFALTPQRAIELTMLAAGTANSNVPQGTPGPNGGNGQPGPQNAQGPNGPHPQGAVHR